MPSTRSGARAQPQLQFPRRKSCRVSARSSKTAVDRCPARSPAKDPTADQKVPLSPRQPEAKPVSLSPRRPAERPLSPRRPVSLTPLSPRRPAERPLSPRRPVSLTPLSPRRSPVVKVPPSSPSVQTRVPLSPRKRTGDENSCNVSTLGSPPKQSRPSPLSSPRRSAFSENSENSPCLARRRLIASPQKQPASPAPRPSPRRQETPTGSPHKSKLGSDKKPPVVRLFADKSRFLSVKQALHTAVPERLLSRDSERAAIRQFLEEKVLQKKPGSLYISGAPGTGKTACLNCVLHDMKSQLSSVQTVLLNCMTLRSSHSVFSLLSEKLKSSGGQSGLQKLLTAPGRAVLLVLDEMDQLDSKAQDVLYTIFEWPHLPKSRLCLIGIANALDLTDRILPRLQARPECRPLLLNFPPYSRQELTAIVQDRLAQASAETLLDPSAVQFCARKVSAVSGDARKALDICRRAVEMVESDERKKATDGTTEAKASRVSLPQVARVLSEVYGDRMAQTEGETFPLQQKLLVCCLLLLIRNGKSKEVPLGKLHEAYSRLCARRQVGAAGQSECLSLCSLLESRGIFALKKAKEARLTKIFLKIEEKDVENALKDRTLVGSILAAGLP
ncbi:LOW QUALITY PROTEIN: cell division control protein 6 homolog [Boleophthalmus pectinirostris]|uniref:LOW QUALITY PROTEIN: cell division control protein 6 homolog n=1 Tax=Boleophthalmus pectinirostris TaxID=150288 RepID=UPI000A1C31E5|nr:LOW QUALITY PROTEIN: cell division control protein 6 homolog [Boleophthalmus pectinirostris]